jgi:hypothetical protein
MRFSRRAAGRPDGGAGRRDASPGRLAGCAAGQGSQEHGERVLLKLVRLEVGMGRRIHSRQRLAQRTRLSGQQAVAGARAFGRAILGRRVGRFGG